MGEDRSRTHPRVIALGLDAAEWELVAELAATGVMPNVAALMADGTTARLHSTRAYRSGQAWTQFLAGHEVDYGPRWNSLVFDPDTYEARSVPARPFGAFYADSGLNVLALDVPELALDPSVDGVQITAWGGHSPGYPRASHPPGILRDLDREVGPHPAAANDLPSGWHRPDAQRRILRGLHEGAARRVEAARWLQGRDPDWDLELVVMSEAHSAGEYLWHGIDAAHPLHDHPDAATAGDDLRAVYARLDEEIGALRASAPDDAVVVVFSVHGMTTSHGDTPSLVLLPELLHRLRFGAPFLRDPDQERWRRAGFPPVVPPRGQEWGSFMTEQVLDRPWAARLRSGARRYVPPGAVRSLRSLGRARRSGGDGPVGVLGKPIAAETDLRPDEIEATVSSMEYHVAGWYRPFRPSMRAFALPTFSDGYVRINLEGREREGVVAPADYEAACDEVEAELRRCTNPRTGEPVVAEILRVGRGDPRDADTPYPDLVIGWRGVVDALHHPEVGVVGPFPIHRTGTHTPNGFCVIAGPGVPAGVVESRDVVDLPPTLLHLLGRAVPPRLAGSSILV